MGRIILFSTIVAAGLAQAAPAMAPSEPEPVDKAVAASTEPAASPPVQITEPAAPARETVAEKTVAAPAPAIDPADRDLAAAPPEEIKPGLIDPSAPRRARAVAQRAAPAAPVAVEREARPEPRPQPQQDARREPAAAPAPAVAEAAQVLAERASEAETVPVARDVRRRPILSVPAAAARAERRAPPAPVRSERVAAAPPVEEQAPWSVPSGRRAAAAPAYPADPDVHGSTPAPTRDAEPRPVYADHTRTPPPYPGEAQVDEETAAPADSVASADGVDADRGYGDRASDAPAPDDRGYEDRGDVDRAAPPVRGPRFAIQDRTIPAYPPAAPRAGRRWTQPSGAVDAGCDGGRADRLQQRIRRDASAGRIDERVADDLEDEAAYVGDLERSYCASGMNDWREQRVERHFAQIEERLQYEEDRGWR